MTDQTLKCVDCGASFVFTGGEQEFYREKQFTNPPKRCRGCRAAKKGQAAPEGDRPQKPMWDAVCSDCGADCTVPFQPTSGKPVRCRNCFRRHSEAKEARALGA